MRITFVLPGIGLLGGVKVVLEYANHLTKRGYDVFVVYPLVPMSNATKWPDYKHNMYRMKNIIKNLQQGNTISWYDLKAKLIRVPILHPYFLPDADAIFATSWETAYCVQNCSDRKGEKFYLIQHDESIMDAPDTLVYKTYDLGLHDIVISKWLKNVLEKNGSPAEKLIHDGVNFDEFYPEKSVKNNTTIRILMPYRTQAWKGVDIGLKAFKIVSNRYKNVELVMYGSPPRKKELPDNVEFHTLPTFSELRHIINNCDIFLYTSHSEGFGLPPTEAMACNIPVVTTEVGAVPEYTIPGITALVSKPGDFEDLAKNIIDLIENVDKRHKIAQNGFEYIKQFTWDKSTDQLEEFIKKNTRS
jgi:L-malate glycosyltransferase